MNLVIYKIQAPIREIWNTWLFLVAKASIQSFYWDNHISYTEGWWAKKSSKISFYCYEKTVIYTVSPKQKGAFFIFSTHAHPPTIHTHPLIPTLIHTHTHTHTHIYIYIYISSNFFECTDCWLSISVLCWSSRFYLPEYRASKWKATSTSLPGHKVLPLYNAMANGIRAEILFK